MFRKHKWLFIVLTIASLVFFIFIASCRKVKAPDFEADYDVIIIGGGLGGLSAAAHLAKNDLKVLLLEQHHKVGGCSTNFKRGDFVFETALHEMAGGGPRVEDGDLKQLMTLCGVYDKVKTYQLPDLYRSIYPGVDITLPPTWEGWDNTLKERWPEESEGIDKFHRLCTDFTVEFMSLSNLFRYGSFRTFTVKMQVPIKQRLFFEWQSKTLEDLMDECFEDERLKAVVSQFWVYYGAPVKDQSAIIMLIANDTYLNEGPVHVMGTSQNLANAYAESIEEMGGTVKTGTLVTEIIIEDGIAKGVKTEFGDVYTARYIVANTDPYQLIYKLIGQDNLPKKYVEKVSGMKVANSLFGVYLGLNIDLKKLGYDDTEIFYNTSLDSTLVYENMMKGNFKEGASTLTIYSNYGDPIYAPKGKSVVVLHSYCDYNIWPKDKEEYQKMKEEKAWELINLAANAIPEIKEKRYIEEMEILTPVTINEFTLNHGGVIYGFYLDVNQWQKIPIRTPIDNVFIASNWTELFHGFGSVQINGWMANRLIMDIEGLEYE